MNQDVWDCAAYLNRVPAAPGSAAGKIPPLRQAHRLPARRGAPGFRPAVSLRFPSERFEKALQGSRTLREVLEAYFQTRIQTNRERRRERGFSALLREALETGETA